LARYSQPETITATIKKTDEVLVEVVAEML